nr:MAG TPA: hypothetical protein [Caudoviricetes sp.]
MTLSGLSVERDVDFRTSMLVCRPEWQLALIQVVLQKAFK